MTFAIAPDYARSRSEVGPQWRDFWRELWFLWLPEYGGSGAALFQPVGTDTTKRRTGVYPVTTRSIDNTLAFGRTLHGNNTQAAQLSWNIGSTNLPTEIRTGLEASMYCLAIPRFPSTAAGMRPVLSIADASSNNDLVIQNQTSTGNIVWGFYQPSTWRTVVLGPYNTNRWAVYGGSMTKADGTNAILSGYRDGGLVAGPTSFAFTRTSTPASGYVGVGSRGDSTTAGFTYGGVAAAAIWARPLSAGEHYLLGVNPHGPWARTQSVHFLPINPLGVEGTR